MTNEVTAETTETTETTTDQTRRSFLKTSLLAGGGLALAAAGTDTGAAQSTTNALVYSYEFHPASTVRIEDRLLARTTVGLLKLPNGRTVPEITQPDDYNGYVVRYLLGNPRSSITTFLFSRNDLRVGERYRLSGTAQLFSTELNVVGTTISRRNGDGTNDQ